MARQRICALGSSFASGPGIKPLDDVSAGRSAKNYPHLLAAKLGAELTDLTCSGATLLDVLNTQAHQVLEDADLVTLTAGGNDLGYSYDSDRALRRW